MTRLASVVCLPAKHPLIFLKRLQSKWVLNWHSNRQRSSAPLRQFGLKIGLSVGLWPLMLDAHVGLAAERLTVSYGALERSISIESLALYAVEGTVRKDLRTYLGYLNETQRDQLRQALQARANIDVVAVSQFLYTEQGEILLQRLGEVVRTDSHQSGFFAIRSALILAADDPQGLTALNVLETFPLSNIRIDLNRTLEILSELQTLIRQTQEAALLVEQESLLEAESENLKVLPDLRQQGVFRWQILSLQMDDPSRERRFPVDLYLPETANQIPVNNAPVIVISHGLGSDRGSYAYLARQLASYGFAVAVPEHLGSNAAQLQALVAGTVSEVTAPAEFVDRPLDVKYLLDELTRLNQVDPVIEERLNLNQVGVVGQSFGGYTALALAGAPINLQQLATDCEQVDPYNLSLLLQCRALESTRPLPNLQDPRVKAIIAINPIGSSLIGADGYAQIRVPVMLVSGSADTIAPALPEQMRPFTWLETSEKYLALLQGGTHFSTIDVPEASAATAFQLPSEIVGPDPQLAQDYMRVLGVAFFQTHLVQNPDYRPYLEAVYIQSISQNLLSLSFIRSLSSIQLTQLLPEPASPPALP